MNTIALGILGAIFGSFFDVLALRYDPDRPLFAKHTLGGRSHCSHCKHVLAWYELIPVVSFIVQRGKCRSCGARISPENLWVELVSAAIFALVPHVIFNSQIYLHGPALQLWLISAVWIAAFMTLLLTTLIDLRHRIIPDEANIILVVLGLVLVVIEAVSLLAPHRSFIGSYGLLFGLGEPGMLGMWGILLNRLLGVIAGLALFGGLYAITRGRGMGMGDVKLIAALGVLFGWPDTLVLSAFAFIVGSIASIVLMITKGLTRKSAVPFGPFIAAGAAIIFFFGVTIASHYFGLIM
jgi:leader peptidase (prepilin peptidase) / N-methyltransferase